MLDWEFAHAGSPYTDLGNAVRFDRQPAWVDAVVAAYDDPSALDLARRADLWALVELAARHGRNPVADAAHDLLRAIAGARDVHAAPPAFVCDRPVRTRRDRRRIAAGPEMARGPASRSHRAFVVPPTGFEPALPP